MARGRKQGGEPDPDPVVPDPSTEDEDDAKEVTPSVAKACTAVIQHEWSLLHHYVQYVIYTVKQMNISLNASINTIEFLGKPTFFYGMKKLMHYFLNQYYATI